jgi:hypothetical protein
VPTVSVTPASIAFGNQLINTTSSPQAVTVVNTGTVPVVITSIGLGTVRFTQTNNCPIGGTGLAVGRTASMVTFTPNRRVARTATLTIPDNAVGGVQRVTLTGTGP